MRRAFPAICALVALGLLSSAGCGTGTKDVTKPIVKKGPVHDHPETGPHGGVLAEWGDEEYHVEFTVDHDKKQATVYILDGDKAAKATPIEAETLNLTLRHAKEPVEIILKAEPDAGDPKGKSSRFVAVHDVLGEKIDFKGDISGKVGTKPFHGDFVEKADHHDHKKK